MAGQSIPVRQILTAMMKYNDRAATNNKQRIYIFRMIAQECYPHLVKEADGVARKTRRRSTLIIQSMISIVSLVEISKGKIGKAGLMCNSA
jgi:hypothetical protein